MTSGSLFQCLQVSQEAKIDSEATPADDIEGALKAHLAPGELCFLPSFLSLPLFDPIHPPSELVISSQMLTSSPHHRVFFPDYTTSLSTFQTRLAQDATSFRPFGRKIGSYTRPSGAKEAESKGKGKGKASNESNPKKRALEGDEEEEEGDVVFEMWKVSWAEEDEGLV